MFDEQTSTGRIRILIFLQAFSCRDYDRDTCGHRLNIDRRIRHVFRIVHLPDAHLIQNS